MFQVESAYLSDPGLKRPRNDDFALAFEPDDPAVLQGIGCLYLVADGATPADVAAERGEYPPPLHSGRQTAPIKTYPPPAEYACWNVLAAYYGNPHPNPGIRLKQAMRQVGNEIFRYAFHRQATGSLTTTMVAVALHGESCTVANVGDSRAYLIRLGAAEQITRDHANPADLPSDQGSLDAPLPRDATAGRSLGGELEVFVDVFPDIPLHPGDRLLLCSNGLTRHVRPHELAQLASTEAPAEAVARLVELARQRGGEDNITALLVAIGERMVPAPLLPGAPRGRLPRPVSWESLEAPQPASLESTQPSAARLQRQQATPSSAQPPSSAAPPPNPLAAARQVFGRHTAPLIMVLAAASCLALAILASVLLPPYLRQRGMLSGATVTPPGALTPGVMQPTAAPLDSSPAIATPISAPALALTLTAIPAIPLETPTPVSETAACVLTVQEGDTLYAIITRLEIALQPQAIACASTNNGGCAYDPAQPDVLGVGWRMVFPDVKRDVCLANGGEPP